MRSLLPGVLLLAGCAFGCCGSSADRRPAEECEALPADPQPWAAPPPPAENTEHYTDYGQRPFVSAAQDPLSTFSVDVDTGSYTIARRKLREGRLPPPAAVRAEEFVNYFRQDYPDPVEGTFNVVSHAAPSPFRPGQVLLEVGLQARHVLPSQRRPANLVFLVDVSGSMRSPDKLGLLKDGLGILVRALRPDDVVAICTYAGAVRTVLPPTPVRARETILAALARLSAGGSTAMASGIDLAYALAAQGAGPGVSSRVIVCSDGDANVGPASHGEILARIADQRRRGITLGTVGFGMGNYQDTLMEQLADRGDGSYAYVDDLAEARRLFAEDLTASLELVARDVKLQLAFDPARVARYRLIGYENRALADEAFRDDAQDAGEVGAGHTVTALYALELVPGGRGPLGRVRLRYRDAEPAQDGETHEEAWPLAGQVAPSFAAGPQRMRIACCAAELAEVLRGSPYTDTSLELLAELTEASLGGDDARERELLELIQRAAALWPERRGEG